MANMMIIARKLLERKVRDVLNEELGQKGRGVEYNWLNKNAPNRVLRGKTEDIEVTISKGFNKEEKAYGKVTAFGDGKIKIVLTIEKKKKQSKNWVSKIETITLMSWEGSPSLFL